MKRENIPETIRDTWMDLVRLCNTRRGEIKMSADNYTICPQCWKENKDLEDMDLRECYEIFTDKDGTFYINYFCCCNTCDFEYEFEKTAQVTDGIIEKRGGEISE